MASTGAAAGTAAKGIFSEVGTTSPSGCSSICGAMVVIASALESSSVESTVVEIVEIPAAAQDSPPPSPSSSTAIVDVERDSPALSFICNPRRPRLAARLAEIVGGAVPLRGILSSRRARCAFFSSNAAVRPSYPPPLPSHFDPPPLAINRALRPRDPPTPRPPVPPTLVASAIVRRRCSDPALLPPVTCSPPRSSAAAAWARLLRRRCSGPAPPQPLVALGSSLTEFWVSSATRGLPLD
ncbi:hypothetical protein Scep_004347 [Stephania cephalantha]|uniref:Uncharacterized protein n=1 Tax=Stephania cephalantha TaxID=152367 RepID=A0AAP0KTR7_9MAGN